MLLPERFSCSITFSSFSKFLFGIPCTFTFVFLPSISVLEILLFNFQRSCARIPSGSCLPFGASFSILLSPAPFVKPFFKFFSGFRKKRAAGANRLFFSLRTRFLRPKTAKASPKHKKSAVFKRIIAQRTCAFLSYHDIIEKSVSVDDPTDRHDPNGNAYRSPSQSRRGKGEFGWTNK